MWISESTSNYIENNSYSLCYTRLVSLKEATILPVVSTSRSTSLFDLIPVNILRKDAKEISDNHDNKKANYLDDISLVPAESSARIQVYFLLLNILIA